MKQNNKNIKRNRKQHRFINTPFGEIKLVGKFDNHTKEHYCEMYIGDNWDNCIGEVICNISDEEDVILIQIEKFFNLITHYVE
jgi:hypothetical protein